MTARTLLAIGAFGVLSGWVSGQGPRRLASDEAALVKRNRTLLENLLDDGLKLADAETPLDRAMACRRAADRLALELASAVRYDDADRVGEIGEQLTVLLADGFLPPFRAARSEIGPQSPEFGRLKSFHAECKIQFDETLLSLPSSGKLANLPQVSGTRQKLIELADRLGLVGE